MFKDTVTKFPRTWAKRSFLSLKNGLTSKFLKTVKFTKSVFKKETWSKLYQTFKMATITKTDDLFSSLTGKKKPINTPDKTPGTPNKNSGKTHPDNKAPNTKTPGDKTPDVDESELSKVSKYEDDVDDATKKKMRDKADNEVEKGPNHDSKTKALIMARIITQTNDELNTPVPILLAELSPLKSLKGVNDFKAEGGQAGKFQIYMIGSKFRTDDGEYDVVRKKNTKQKKLNTDSNSDAPPLPTLDATGKVHGTLPKVEDFYKYSREELEILLNELKSGVKKRIEVTSVLGRDRPHGQRQGSEHSLIKSLTKYLDDTR